MSDELKIRFDGSTMRFLAQKKASGKHRSAQDYVRHLVRQEMESEQNQSTLWLRSQLRPGLLTPEDEFLTMNASAIIAEAIRRGAPE